MQPLTPYERKAVALTFRKARAILEEFKCQYICTALYWTLPSGYSSEEYRIHYLAKSVVRERLEGARQLESWLSKQGFFIPREPTPELKQKLHNHRLQWLNMLIAEFEGEKS